MTTQDLTDLAHKESLDYSLEEREQGIFHDGYTTGFLKALNMVEEYLESVEDPVEGRFLKDDYSPFQNLLPQPTMTKAQLPQGIFTLNDFLHRQVSYPDAVFGPKLTIYLTVIEVNQEEEYMWLKYNHLTSQSRVGIPKFLEWLSTGEYTLLPQPTLQE